MAGRLGSALLATGGVLAGCGRPRAVAVQPSSTGGKPLPPTGGAPAWPLQTVRATPLRPYTMYATSGAKVEMISFDADLWGAADTCGYYYAKTSGDGQWSVRVTRLALTSGYAKAGLMVRQSADPGSPNVTVEVEGNGSVAAAWRLAQGGPFLRRQRRRRHRAAPLSAAAEAGGHVHGVGFPRREDMGAQVERDAQSADGRGIRDWPDGLVGVDFAPWRRRLRWRDRLHAEPVRAGLRPGQAPDVAWLSKGGGWRAPRKRRLRSRWRARVHAEPVDTGLGPKGPRRGAVETRGAAVGGLQSRDSPLSGRTPNGWIPVFDPRGQRRGAVEGSSVLVGVGGMPGVFLLGYDVESPDPAVTSAFLTEMRRVHTAAAAPATLYVVGTTALRHGDDLAALRADPLFDLQQHTYSHRLLKTVCQENERGTTVYRGVSFEEAIGEVRGGQEALLEACGVRCTGLTAPYNYYRGLSDRPDLLQVCWDAGIRYLRSDGRDAHDWQPVPLQHQPYWYGPQGFPRMLEFCLHGWQDCILRDQLGWEQTDAYVRAVRQWLEAAAAADAVFSYVQHDWSSIRGDPQMDATAGILEAAGALGMRRLLYSEYYGERVAALGG